MPHAARVLVIAILASFTVASFARPAAPMGLPDARHLLGRTSFGPRLEEVQRFAALDRGAAVDLLLSAPSSPPPPPPAGVETFVSRRQLQALPEPQQETRRREIFAQSVALKGWWLERMATSDAPFTEWMTLFWHGLLTSSFQKVRSPNLLWRQHLTLRTHALGVFDDLLLAMARDPAMVVYLDNVSNLKTHPNENFARELMELFTVGLGPYSEHDVKEAARAFTGWGINRDTGDFRFFPQRHDPGLKTVLGRTGPLDGQDVIDVLLARDETARRLVRRLWVNLVSPTPDEVWVDHQARRLKASGYEIQPTVRALLLSDAFWAEENRGTLVRSPVEWVAGTLRALHVEPKDGRLLARITAEMGQDLLDPPSVAGWPGAEAWIDTRSLTLRRQFVDGLFALRDAAPVRGSAGGREIPTVFDPDGWLSDAQRRFGCEALTEVLLPIPPAGAARGGCPDTVWRLHQHFLDPVAQLK